MKPRVVKHTWIILMLVWNAFLGANAGQCKFRFPPYSKGYCLTSSACPGAVLSSLCPGQQENIGCCVLENFPDYGTIRSNITLKMFTDIFNSTDRSESQYEHFVHSLKTAGAISCHQQSAYIAQIAIDTNFLSSMEQAQKNLQKMQQDDVKYVGRGAIHVPGKKFYRWLGGKTGNNLIDMPEKLAYPTKAFWSAALIWNHSYSIVNDGTLNHVTYNKLADGSKYGFMLLRYFLKGHTKDVERIMGIWKIVNQVLRCPCVENRGPQCHVTGRHGRCKYVADCKGKQVVNFQHCKGPLNAVRCCLDFATPVELKTFVSGGSLLHKRLPSVLKWIHQRIAANIESNVTVSALKLTSQQSHVALNQSEERSTKFVESNKAVLPQSRNSNKTEPRLTKDVDLLKQPIDFKRKVVLLLTDNNLKRQDLSTTLNMEDEQGLILYIHYEETRSRVTAWDMLLDYGFTLEEPFIEERLTEKITTGPWHLTGNRTFRLHLEENEMIFLAIPVSETANTIPLLSINNKQGAVKVAGVQRPDQLPANQNYYCETNCTRKIPINEEQSLLKVEYHDKSSTRTERIWVLLINSKAVFYISGLQRNNTIELRVSQSHKVEPSSNHQFAVSLPVIFSSVWVVICGVLSSICLIKFMNAAQSYLVSEKIVCKAVEDCEPSTNMDAISPATGSFFLHHQKNSYGPAANSQSFHHLSSSYCQIPRPSRTVEHKVDCKRSSKILAYVDTCIVIFIVLNQITFITAAMLRMCKTSCSVNIFAATFSSNAVYVWILMQCILGFSNTNIVHKLFDCSLMKILLIHVLNWGLPAIFSSVIVSLPRGDRHRFCWLIIEQDRTFWVEVGFKSFLILCIVLAWIALLWKYIFDDKDSRTSRWQVMRIPILLAQFTVSWIMASMLLTWPSFNYYKYLLMANNLFMGGFVLFSVYYQMKENSSIIQRQKQKEENCHDVEAVSPAISRHVLYGEEVSVENGKIS